MKTAKDFKEENNEEIDTKKEIGRQSSRIIIPVRRRFNKDTFKSGTDTRRVGDNLKNLCKFVEGDTLVDLYEDLRLSLSHI